MEKPIWLQIIEGERMMRVGILRLPGFGFEEIPQDIYDMDWLVELDLTHNEITTIKGLEKLKILKVLNLSYNKLETLNTLDNPHLFRLILSNNNITSIEPLYKKLKQGLILRIDNNPIADPPIEIVNQGSLAITNYFDEIYEQGEEVVFEAKVIIIGDAGVGKTSLTNKIINPTCVLPKKTDTTVGIEIKSFVFDGTPTHPGYKLNIWDLAGQDIYLPIHQLFFSNRCLYILIDDGRKENKIESFWLPAQELFGGNSPVLIMHNKQGDLQPSIPFNVLKSRFENIKGELSVIDLSVELKKIEQFRNELKHQFSNLPQFVKQQKLPKIWASIKTKIESINQNFLYLNEFKKIFHGFKIYDEEKQEFITDYLHDLGVILRFKDKLNPLLNKFIILKPEWALEAIYKVLKHNREQNSNGIFTYEQLAEIWNDNHYAETMDELLGLMKKFELCYSLNDHEYLIPSLLPADIPYKEMWDNAESTVIKYDYDFMPRGIISRLIVRLHNNIDKSENMWREGVVFDFDGNKAMVSSIAQKRIEISAKGRKPSSILSIVTREIESIHKDFKFNDKLKLTKKVPCICKTCKGSLTPSYYDYEDLLKRNELGKKTIECSSPPNYEDVSVDKLLENIDTGYKSKFKTKSKSGSLKAFISYSKYDGEESRDNVNYLAEFKEMLAPLIKHSHQIEDWDDTKLIAGENWDERIVQELYTSDIIFLLISNSFLNTNYIINTELKIAFEREKHGECIVIPIIVKDSGWSDIRWLSSINAIPRKGQTISSWQQKWSSKDQAWKHVYDEIKKLMLSFEG